MTGRAGTVRRIAVRAAAIVAGVLFGFFFAFNVVFSDVFGLREMLLALVVVFGAYAILGSAFGLLEPDLGWRWVVWLAPPGVLLVLWAVADAPGRILYHLAVIAAIVGGVAPAAAVSGLLRRPK